MKPLPSSLVLLALGLVTACADPGEAAPPAASGAGPGSEASAGAVAPAGTAWEAEAILLVRHAERAPEPAEDPGLTSVGEERARELARLLSGAGITAIHSTDTRRTRDTAAPLSELLGLSVESYGAGDLEGFGAGLRGRPGRHLVVGHSNTTPELARALGGEGYGPIEEGWEYDRLYLLTRDGDGGVTTLLLRFGPPVSGS